MSLATIIMTELLLAYASSTNDNFKGGGARPCFAVVPQIAGVH